MHMEDAEFALTIDAHTYHCQCSSYNTFEQHRFPSLLNVRRYFLAMMRLDSVRMCVCDMIFDLSTRCLVAAVVRM